MEFWRISKWNIPKVKSFAGNWNWAWKRRPGIALHHQAWAWCLMTAWAYVITYRTRIWLQLFEVGFSLRVFLICAARSHWWMYRLCNAMNDFCEGSRRRGRHSVMLPRPRYTRMLTLVPKCTSSDPSAHARLTIRTWWVKCAWARCRRPNLNGNHDSYR